MAYSAYPSVLDSAGQSSFSNSAYSQALTGPVNVDDSYQFGDIITGKGAAKTQAKQQAELDYAEWVRNATSAASQRQWEEFMDNTKVQRSMADLKAAGLNPWLAVQSAGFGGSIPSGSAASSSAGQVVSSGNPMMGVAATAAGIATILKVVAKIVSKKP